MNKPIAICVCGHSIQAHEEAEGECEGCANDFEDGYCRRFTLYGYEDEDGEIFEVSR